MHRVLRPFTLPALLQSGHGAEDSLVVDCHGGAVHRVREVDRVAVRRVEELNHLDPARLDRPERIAPANTACAVGRTQLLLDRRSERVERAVRPFFDEQRAVGERNEAHRVALDVGRLDGDDRVGLAGAVEARDPGLLPRRPRFRRRLPAQPSFAGEALVQRLTPPEQSHYTFEASPSSACLSILRFDVFLSRSSLIWRSSFSVRSSIDAFMSRVASRARSVWPLSQTVASATWFAATDGLRSTASSTSTRVSSCRCLSSFASLRSA